MTVKEALNNRFSCRVFQDIPVEKQVLDEIFEDAFRTPSWANSQPWDIYVAGKEQMEKILQGMKDCRKQRVHTSLDLPFSGVWSEEAKKHMDQFFDDVYACEERRNLDFTMQNRNLFYAPCSVFICMEKGLPAWSYYDIGAFSQSLMLSATEHGLATIPAAVFVGYPDLIRRILQIPDKKDVIIGIGIGYADMDVKVNHFKSRRKPISEVVYCGIES